MDKPEKDNVVVDFHSRLTNNSDTTPIDDYFPNEYLFAISTHSSWYLDIVNYLVAGKFPPHLSLREQGKIIQQSA